jgi:hypothetical protein
VRSVQLCVGGDAAQGVPHHDAGVEVRRIFHKLSSEAVEPVQWLVRERLCVAHADACERFAALSATGVGRHCDLSIGVVLSTRAQPVPCQGHYAPVEGGMIYDHA